MKKWTCIVCMIFTFVLVGVLKLNSFQLQGEIMQIYNGVLETFYVDCGQYVLSRRDTPQVISKKDNKASRLIRNPFLKFDTKHSNNIRYSSAHFDKGNIYVLEEENSSVSIKEINLQSFSERVVYKEGISNDIKGFLDLNNDQEKPLDIEQQGLNNIKQFFIINNNIFLVKENKITVYNIENKKSKEILKDEDIMDNNISCDGKDIYFINKDYYIIKYSLKDKNFKNISEQRAKKLLLTSDGILYTSLNKNHLYYIDRKGGNKKEIINKGVSTFNYDKEYIYYSNSQDNKTLYRVKYDGSDNKKLTKNPAYFIYTFHNYDKIYFMSDEEDKSTGEYVSFYSIDKDGCDFKKLNYD